jgi:hypothetical protein
MRFVVDGAQSVSRCAHGRLRNASERSAPPRAGSFLACEELITEVACLHPLRCVSCCSSGGNHVTV